MVVQQAIFRSRSMIQLKRLSSLFSFIFFVLLFRESSSTTTCNARELETTRWIVPAKKDHELDLYIHRGLNYSLVNAFADILLELNLTDEDSYDLYKADNCSVVEENFRMDNRLFGFFKGANFWRSRQLHVFNDTVIGISTQLPYTVHAKILKLNYIRFGVFMAGVLLFLFAKDLVRSSPFFYGSGCSLGLLASLLIIVFIMYRVAPKTLIGLPFLIGGWSLSVYVLHLAWRNLSTIVVQYQKFMVAYFVSVLAISFAVCYKRGPPTDSRSHDIAQWTLQAIALLLIYSSAQIQEVSLGIISILLLHTITRSCIGNLLHGITNVLTTLWWKVFPPKPRLLTKAEYEKEGKEVTKRELERLRDFCRSPKADVWKITCKVRDPRRFARFVDGKEDHILEDEEILYEDESLSSNMSNHVDDYDDGSSRQKHPFLDNDVNDDNDWEEELMYLRTPRSRSDNISMNTKSPRRSTGLFPSDSPRSFELPPHSRSAYHYRESPRSLNHRRPVTSMSASSRPRDTENDSSFIRKYKERQELTKIPGKRRLKPTSNEFFSSDSESDLEEA